MHHLFPLSRTLRIRQLNGLGCSIVESISPLRAIGDYASALTNFHVVSRAAGPRSQLTSTRGLPNTAQVVQDIAFCGLGCGLAISPGKVFRTLPCAHRKYIIGNVIVYRDVYRAGLRES